MTRPPADVDGRPEQRSVELTLARQLIERSGLVAALEPHIDAEVGRPRRLSLEALPVGLMANALGRHHQGHLIEVARLLNSLSDRERAGLGIVEWDPEETYLAVDRLFCRLVEVLESGLDGISTQWFVDRLLVASVPRRHLTSRSVAVDGTDIETWGAFQGSVSALTLDGEAIDERSDDSLPPPSRPKTVRRAKVLGIGPDGRRRYTPDPDARAGHRLSVAMKKSPLLAS